MIEKIMIKKPILEENEKVQKQIEIARATEGFSHLTEKQQQIIKLSLYMQARGERYDTDENENILKVNKKSTQYVADKNCHTSILNLENEDMTKAPGDVRTTKDFFEAKYSRVMNISELKKQVEEFGFPCVIHVSSSPNEDFYSKDHSALVLGHNKENTIVVWEKEGYEIQNPYRITTLENIYKTFGTGYYYGLRKLRKNS